MSLLEKLKGNELPSDLGADIPDEIRDEFTPDPAPGKKRAERAPAAPRTASAKRVTIAAKKQLTDELEAYARLAALGWSTRDQYCGGVLNDQSRAIADALAELLARNPKLVEWVHTTGMLGDWVKLWLAVEPVVSAIRDHHVTKVVAEDDEPAAVADNARYPAFRPAA